ncbi:hypothetical protein NPX13_g6830 [Xylaria arbuscula]|uniref:Uncharacterized protein n=1 Tax=Xylaria arbuscula TaxID=114810 RepID=A0A9W8TK22_9PEZI|nr:hypothetical protein NPX13_g6830 [Xylaria arbuscula]
MSSRDIALKIALLHLTKGNIHEEMQQAVTNPDFLTRQPRDQFRFREDMARRLREIVQAIRAWEEIGDKRAENLFSPSLVDMLMITHDHQPASPAVARTENEKEENGEDGAGV